ncbi:C-type mannose receptor 2, partial [Silurus meridionalis]
MKTTYSFLLLAALIGASKCMLVRKYIYVGNSMSWTDAQTYCRTNYVDLLTINSQDEYNRFIQQANSFLSKRCWIGLYKKPDKLIFTYWSDGSLSGGLLKWDSPEPDYLDTEHCTHTVNGKWYNSFCSTTREFFCYTWTYQVIVVPELKSWTEALEHCRTFYTDLISLTPDTAMVLAKKQNLNIQTPAFWTGLRFFDGSWLWVNKEPLGQWTTLPSCPARPFLCGARQTEADVWEISDCEKKMNFICYNK